MLLQDFNIIIDSGVSAPVHVKEVVDGLDDKDRSFSSHLIDNVQLPGSKIFDLKMAIHTSRHNYDVSLIK